MYIIIGQIDSNEKVNTIEACRIIDTETKEIKDIYIERIKQSVKNGVKVVGLKAYNKVNWRSNKKSMIVKKEIRRFDWEKIPKLNGAGQLLNDEDARFVTVYGWSGFAEMKRYHVINYEGEETLLTIDELRNKISNNEVNGAILHNNKVQILEELSKEL